MPRKTFRKKLIPRRRPYHKGGMTHRRRPFGGFRKKIKQINKLACLTLSKGIHQMFPDRLCTKMKNQFTIYFTGTSGAVNAFVSAGNALHNPLSTGILSGATPLAIGGATSIYGLGNILSSESVLGSAGPYANYRVVSSCVKATVQNTSAASADASNLFIIPLDGNTVSGVGNVSSANLSILTEIPYSKNRTVSGTTVNRGVFIKHAMSTARMYALRYRASLEDPAYSGSFGTNPTNLWYWAFYWVPDTSNSTTATVVVQQEYWVEFYNRNALASTQG